MGQLSEPLIIEQLSLAERILIVEEIWDSIVAEQASLPVTHAQQAELDRRLDAYHTCPGQGASWEGAKTDIRAK